MREIGNRGKVMVHEAVPTPIWDLNDLLFHQSRFPVMVVSMTDIPPMVVHMYRYRRFASRLRPLHQHQHQHQHRRELRLRLRLRLLQHCRSRCKRQ